MQYSLTRRPLSPYLFILTMEALSGFCEGEGRAFHHGIQV